MTTFMCVYGGCDKTFKTARGRSSHYSRAHLGEVSEEHGNAGGDMPLSSNFLVCEEATTRGQTASQKAGGGKRKTREKATWDNDDSQLVGCTDATATATEEEHHDVNDKEDQNKQGSVLRYSKRIAEANRREVSAYLDLLAPDSECEEGEYNIAHQEESDHLMFNDDDDAGDDDNELEDRLDMSNAPPGFEFDGDGIPVCPPVKYTPDKVLLASGRRLNTETMKSWLSRWIFFTKNKNKMISIEAENGLKCTMTDSIELLNLVDTDPNFAKGWDIYSNSEIAELSLMGMLNRVKCPLYMYDYIVLWAKESFSRNRCTVTPSMQNGYNDLGCTVDMMRNRDHAMKHYDNNRGHMKAMYPQTNRAFKLHHSSGSVPLTTIPFLGSLYSILQDSSLMQDNNLLLNSVSPCLLPDSEVGVFDDFDTGSRFRDSFAQMKKDDIDLPLGIVLFVDSSVMDKNDRLSTDMAAFTTSLFRRSTRYKSGAWRSLGSIPNFRSTDHKGPDEKIKDYHVLLEEVLRSLRDVQTNHNGILFPLFYKGEVHMVRFRPYILCVLGDTPGHNKLAGKMNGAKCNRMCRYCDILGSDLSKPFTKSNLVTKKKVQEYQKSATALKEFSYKKVDNAFDNIDFGSDVVGGIHQNLPAEMIHVHQHGLMVIALDGLFTIKSQNAKERKKAAENTRALDSVDTGLLEEEDSLEVVTQQQKEEKKQSDREKLIRSGAFGGPLGLEVDVITKHLGRVLQRQSDRDLPTVHFSRGIISRSKICASEYQGVCLLALVLLSSTYAIAGDNDSVSAKISPEKLGGYVGVLEYLITSEEFMKGTRGEKINKCDLESIEWYTKMNLEKMKQVIDRTVGNGMDLIKFHLPVHMLGDDIRKFGSPSNVCGGPGESQFKENFKLPGETTQKRDYLLDEQLYKRRYDHLVIQRCLQNAKLARIGHVGGGIPDVPFSLQRENSSGEDIPVQVENGEVHGSVAPSGQHQDLAEQQTADGLSSQSYVMVVCRLASGTKDDPLLPHLLYVGDGRTIKARLFRQVGSTYVDSNNTRVGNTNTMPLDKYNKEFEQIFDTLCPVLKRDPSICIQIYTCLRKDRVHVYRSDPLSPHKSADESASWIVDESWQDWGLFSYKEKINVFHKNGGKRQCFKDVVYPGKILFFFMSNKKIKEAMNAISPARERIKDSGGYAFCTLTRYPLVGFLDTGSPPMSMEKMRATIINQNEGELSGQAMQPNSDILYWERLRTCRDNTEQTARNGRGPTPKMRLHIGPVSIQQLSGPVVAIPDFSPEFVHEKKSNAESRVMTLKPNSWVHEKRWDAYIFMKPRRLWNGMFVKSALKLFKENKELG